MRPLDVFRGETAVGNFAELLERRKRWLRVKRKIERKNLKKLKKARPTAGPPKAEKKDPVDAVAKASGALGVKKNHEACGGCMSLLLEP